MINMKKQILFLILFMLFFSGIARAQSTYLYPWRGATQTYTATVTDPGNVNPVRWYVSTDAFGTTKAVYGTDYTFVTGGYNSATDQLEGTAVYSIDISWGTTVAEAANFYVFMEVDDNSSGCTNRMALHVQVAADFNAVVYDVTGSSDPETVDPNAPGEDVLEETCPDDIQNPLWNGTGHTDIGYSELVYRVNRQFSVLGWQFEYALSEGTSQAFTLENIRFVNQSGTQLYSGTSLTGTIPAGSTEDYVMVYVQITNQQGKTLDMNMDLVTTHSNTKDDDNNLDSNASDNNADHIILPMPVISGFSGN